MVFDLTDIILNKDIACIVCGDDASELPSGTFPLSVRSDERGNRRLGTRDYGDVFVVLCTCKIYAYVRGSAKMSQFRWCSATSRVRGVTKFFEDRFSLFVSLQMECFCT